MVLIYIVSYVLSLVNLVSPIIVGLTFAHKMVPYILVYCRVLLLYISWSLYIQEIKNIKNVKICRDGMPKSMQTR